MSRLAALFFGILWIPLCPAANFSVSISASDPSVADPAYPATGSTITTGFDKQTQVTVTVAGRNYGTVPLIGPRWGLKAEPLPWKTNKDGFVITGGFQPSAAGSKLTTTGTEASYLSFTIPGVQANTRFQNFSIELDGLTFVNTLNMWGAASVGGFANWVVPSYNSNTGKLTLDLADFTSTTSGPVEFRLYGITGLGEGAFTDVKLSGAIIVPEPGTPLLLGAVLAAGFRRHRRGNSAKNDVRG